ncbi:MAG: SDR family NAD(P)-dependent oxidoreductase [Clostridiales bacterium]|jgi:NAD(P)-dependent dehydrogenase (short-subunit alcohol dehydrogenase family)|nr:SDR family NAD(P)-dependent oxidoreductase [Clostridiales bacterium]
MKKTVVITGASRGIGYCAAKCFLDSGYTVYGLSRRAGDLDGVKFIRADLTDEESVISAFDKIISEAGAIDILINNAGSGISGAVEFTELTDARYQMDVNFFGMVRCIKCALGIMRRNGGRIINVSSVAAVFPLPFQAFYSASKSAVNALTMALRNEVRRFGNIQVCAIMPGDVKTGFTAFRRKNEAGDEVYGGTISGTIAGMERDEENGLAPEYLGRLIFKIAGKRRLRPFYTGGFVYKLFVFFERLLPKSFVSYILAKMYIKQ